MDDVRSIIIVISSDYRFLIHHDKIFCTRYKKLYYRNRLDKIFIYYSSPTFIDDLKTWISTPQSLDRLGTNGL